MMLFIACGDDSSTVVTPPTVSTSNTGGDIQSGTSADIEFSFSAEAGFASSTVSATNGTATVSADGTAGADSGTITVSYSAGSTTGAGSVTLSVTDENGNSAEATVIFNVLEEVTTITVASNITSDETWETGKTYILAGRIAVEDGATLTIEPGTVIKGEAGTGSNATALLIARGATLNAVGTAESPIIFTSVADEIEPGQIASPNLDPDLNGLWGGLIILGNARISADNESEQIEGIPVSDSNGLYGGTDDTDNSGTIQYVSIRHGGANIGEGNEINGLTLGGVGSGTTIDHIEIVGNQDDGVEWFGGTVNVSSVLVWNAGDDAIDTDQAWAGTLDNFIVISPGDEGFELDGPEGTYAGTGHTITNGTMKADGASGLIDFDDNTDVNISNVYFFGLTADQDVEGYDGYAANSDGFAASSFEATVPDGSAITDFFPAGLATGVAAGANTVGATISEFSFTFASAAGALDDF